MAIELTSTRAAAPPAAGRRFGLRRDGAAVTRKSRAFFTERLALLLSTGNPLHSGLEALLRQADEPAMRAIVEQLLEDVSSGTLFSRALARHPQVFDATYVNLVAAGEQGGFLGEVLEQLTAMEERRAELRSAMLGALSYPAFLLAFSLAVVVFILTAVFPKFAELFAGIANQLPLTTRLLMDLSASLAEYWHVYLAALLGGGLALLAALRRPAGALWLDGLRLRAPFLGRLFSEFYLAQTLRVLSLSLRNGVALLDAMTACREVVGNHVYRAWLDDVVEGVKAGRGLSEGFSGVDFVPDLVVQMIDTGEQSGNLATVMQRVATFYERELMARLKTVARVAEPLMLVVMGALVGLLVSSLILPIFQVSRAVN